MTNWRSATSLAGTIVKWLSVPLLVPLLMALVDGQDLGVFAATLGTALVVGWGLERLETDPDLGMREGFLLVALTWLLAALVGAVPYMLAGRGTVAMPVNAFFESMSGFTTTGATVMKNISVEFHSPALMMWRQLTQWLGGMGIVVLAVAILPRLAVGGAELLEAEAPGPQFSRLVPRIEDTARRLWVLYAGLTALEIVLLYGWHLAGWAPNMSLYNAVAHGLTTMPTGGFSPEARSIEAFVPLVQWTIIPFMFLAGTSFALTWRVVTGAVRRPQGDEEFRTYFLLIGAVTLLLSAALVFEQSTGSVEETARHALFQALTMITTTGYASTDFNAWLGIATTVMFVAMFIGGSTGSTGGGIKVMRWIVSTKAILRELFTSIHPSAVRPIHVGERVVEDRVVRQVVLMIVAYFFLTLTSTAVIEAENVRIGLETDTLSVLSTVAASIGNIGPGFGLIGPMENYLAYSKPTTLLLALLMWAGRLEIFTVLILFTPAYWQE
jgi:trk system potassium uptake protein TrkH